MSGTRAATNGAATATAGASVVTFGGRAMTNGARVVTCDGKAATLRGRPYLQSRFFCHSERSEESIGALAPLPRRVTAAGFFAALRMTNHLKTRPGPQETNSSALLCVLL
jgi:hypothetical protein